MYIYTHIYIIYIYYGQPNCDMISCLALRLGNYNLVWQNQSLQLHTTNGNSTM